MLTAWSPVRWGRWWLAREGPPPRFGITGDGDLANDVEILADGIEHNLEELLARAQLRAPKRPISPITPRAPTTHGRRARNPVETFVKGRSRSRA